MTPPAERSFFSVVWPLVVIAGLAAFIAYEKLGTSATPPATQVSTPEPTPAPATPIPLSDELKAALDAQAARPRANVSTDPASSQPVIRIEVPQQAPQPPPQQVILQPMPSQNGPSADQLEAARRAAVESEWSQRGLLMQAKLNQAYESYRAALCKEIQGGVPLVGQGRSHLDYRSDYVMARAEAEAVLEGARRAGVRVDLSLNQYREPAPATNLFNASLSDWGCR